MKMIPLADLVEIRKGKKHEETSTQSAGSRRYIQIEDLRGNENLKYTDDFKGTEAKPEDIIIAWDGSRSGTIGFGLAGVIGSTLSRLRITEKNISTAFLGRFLQSRYDDIRSNCSGAAIPHVNKNHLESLLIPLPFNNGKPDLEEQKRIAAILDKADAIRRKRTETIRLADDFLKSTFLEMFGDPVTNTKGWDEDVLVNIADIASGVTKGKKMGGKKTVMVPYMRVANVQDGHLVMNDITEIEVLESDVERYRLIEGDILLTEGGDPDKLGRGAVWRGGVDPCIHQNHIFRVRPYEGVLPEFLSHLIRSARGKIYFLKAAKQTTGIASINMTQLKAFPAFIPPLKLQEKFREAVSRSDIFLSRLIDTEKLSSNAFNSLSHRAFRGKL